MAPQRDTLLLVSLADAVVTVAVHVVAGVAVMQVDVGGAVRAGASAELREITRVTGFTAWSPCWLQLQRREVQKYRKICRTLKGVPENYLSNLLEDA